MGNTAYADPSAFFGNAKPKVWNRPAARSKFGDAVLVVFLLSQCFDGVFTYVGVLTFGIGIEANPLITALMNSMGEGVALTAAKGIAATLGILLHLRQVHAAVAALTVFYIGAAILPWTAILFF